jgi:2-furoyl-CoA dehydrogenase large subunit
MGYITLALTPDERAAGLPKSGNAEGCIITISPLGGVSVRLSTTPQGQGHRTVAAQIAADRLGVDPAEIEVSGEMDTSTNAWSVASGAYSSRFSGVGAGAVAAAAAKLAAKIAAVREHAGEDICCGASPDVPLEPGSLPGGWSRGCRRSRSSPHAPSATGRR